MKQILFFICIIASTHSFAQDSTKIKPKQWLGILTLAPKFQDDKNWTKADEAVVGEHFKRLVQMNKEGVVLLAGRTQLETNDPDMMGLVIFYAKDEKEATDFMMNDPAVKNKIMLAKVLPYGIAVGACK
ncbi:YciI family protein [Lacibacter sp. MH-610]|uniref:YciI family protein n=1 Tax=Lacibacter sp. MH-610 TaxID=3020883 RepID=UPI003891959C